MDSPRGNRRRAVLAGAAAALVVGGGAVTAGSGPAGPAGTAAPADVPEVLEQLGTKVGQLLGQETAPPTPTGPECVARLKADAEDRC